MKYLTHAPCARARARVRSRVYVAVCVPVVGSMTVGLCMCCVLMCVCIRVRVPVDMSVAVPSPRVCDRCVFPCVWLCVVLMHCCCLVVAIRHEYAFMVMVDTVCGNADGNGSWWHWWQRRLLQWRQPLCLWQPWPVMVTPMVAVPANGVVTVAYVVMVVVFDGGNNNCIILW